MCTTMQRCCAAIGCNGPCKLFDPADEDDDEMVVVVCFVMINKLMVDEEIGLGY